MKNQFWWSPFCGLALLSANAQEPDHGGRAKLPASRPSALCETYRTKFSWKAPELGLPPEGDGTSPAEKKPAPGRMPGHSPRGEGFDGGPRKLAGLRAGIPPLDFPISTKNPEAQKLFNQGIVQLHGYQFLEAERSFRKVLDLDPNAAMATWGMSLAAINAMTLFPNERAKKLIALAEQQKKTQLAAKNLTPKEAAWIDALAKLNQADAEKAKTGYLTAMKALAEVNPKDVEAQAFYAHALMLTLPDAKDPKSKEEAAKADAVLDKVFALNPQHPAHHYRIHVWDGRDKDKAAKSAIEVGPSATGIAHMWHMPTHYYARRGKFQESAWHEEAALRRDYAYMKEAGVMPNEIHNFTHNATMFVDRLWDLGKANLAYEAAMGFLKTPQDSNAPGSFGVSPIEAVESELVPSLDYAEMWDKVIELRNHRVFAPVNPIREAPLLTYLARAAVGTNNRKLFAEQKTALRCLSEMLAETKYEAAAQPIHVAEAEFAFLEAQLEGNKEKMKAALAGILKASEFIDGDAKAHTVSAIRLARYALLAGDPKAALGFISPLAQRMPDSYQAQSTYAEALYAAGKKDEARDATSLLTAKFGVDFRDKALGPQSRLAALKGLVGNTLKDRPLWKDNKHPPLSDFGPLTWQAPEAPVLTATTADGKPFSLPAKKPVALVFNLGKGCVHCNEQVRKLALQVADLRKAGLEVVVVTNEDQATLNKSLAQYKAAGVEVDFPMVSDPTKENFKKFGVYDEVDKEPLHGMMLIDAEGKVRWRDIAPDPYLSFEYFREESTRLLRDKSPVTR